MGCPLPANIPVYHQRPEESVQSLGLQMVVSHHELRSSGLLEEQLMFLIIKSSFQLTYK